MVQPVVHDLLLNMGFLTGSPEEPKIFSTSNRIGICKCHEATCKTSAST